VEAITDTKAVLRAPRLSGWSIAAGLLVALASQLVFTVLGGAIGLTAFHPGETGAKTMGVGFSVWLIITLCISTFLGAWLACLVAGTPNRRQALEHGLLLWAGLALLGGYGVGGLLGDIVSGLGSVAANNPAMQQPGRAASATALGLWALLVALLLPLASALGGAVMGSRSEARRDVRRYIQPTPAPTPIPTPTPTPA
jgi:hypothetical protein